MIGISLSFDLGRYHATPWGRNVNDAAVEWPPSPWRLLRALYSTARTNVSLGSASDRAIFTLAAAPPPVYELPPSLPAHTRHYMPLAELDKGNAKTSRLLDGFRAMDPADQVRAWWSADLDAEDRAALEAVVAALGYLGRSESVCTAQLLPEQERPSLLRAVPLNSAGDLTGEVVELICPEADTADPLGKLGASVSEMRKRKFLIPDGAVPVLYRVSEPGVPQPAPSPTDPTRPQLARFRLAGGSRPGIREAATLGHLLRAALQRHYDHKKEGARSSVFSGHDGAGFRRDQHRHAHYFATPDPDGRRVEHLVVWAPDGFGPDEVQALSRLSYLTLREHPEPLPVVLTALGPTAEFRLPDLLGPSRLWTSLTPFSLPRHPKRRGGRIVDSPGEQIERELAFRGLPGPEGIELVGKGWAEYQRVRPGKSRRTAPPAVGARITFAEPVGGPIALGALSHFGLGLFRPED